MTKAEEIGARIAQARREKGVRDRQDVRPADLARAVGVSGPTVSEWEAGKITPRDDALERVAKYLGVTPAYLRYGVVVKPITPPSGQPEIQTAGEGLIKHDVDEARAANRAKRDGAKKAAAGDRSDPKRRPKPR